MRARAIGPRQMRFLINPWQLETRHARELLSLRIYILPRRFPNRDPKPVCSPLKRTYLCASTNVSRDEFHEEASTRPSFFLPSIFRNKDAAGFFNRPHPSADNASRRPTNYARIRLTVLRRHGVSGIFQTPAPPRPFAYFMIDPGGRRRTRAPPLFNYLPSQRGRDEIRRENARNCGKLHR